jgi:YggT family protein
LIPLALSRGDVGDYVEALFLVYTVMILVNILLSYVPRIPYSPPLRAVLDFVTESTNPYIRFFGRFLRPIGVGGMGFDLSPLVALVVLFVAQIFVVGLIRG